MWSTYTCRLCFSHAAPSVLWDSLKKYNKKSLQSAYWFCSHLLKCSCMLRSSNEHCLELPSVQVRQSRLFSFVVPRWWNELPSTTRAGASLSTFKKLLKTQLFREHLPS